ncbi:TPA: GNAT family N-acetyltransferase [Klebsiella aerogenes]|nr:GNAT family N-acetyltransferase [Klebsiella aerogenes]
MPAMTDPHVGLISFQEALDNNLLELHKCTVHPDLSLHYDQPEGEPRFTYALIEDGKVKATAVFIRDEVMEDGLPCFGLGYAVAEGFRGQGLGYEIVEKSLAEFEHGIKRHMAKFYIETLVDKDNIPSQKISARHINPESRETTDQYSQTPSYHYEKLIG